MQNKYTRAPGRKHLAFTQGNVGLEGGFCRLKKDLYICAGTQTMQMNQPASRKEEAVEPKPVQIVPGGLVWAAVISSTWKTWLADESHIK